MLEVKVTLKNVMGLVEVQYADLIKESSNTGYPTQTLQYVVFNQMDC
jgi:hypothetical protein